MTATGSQKQQHKPGEGLQRHHIEISIICVSGYRLCAALCSSKDGAVAAAAVSSVYIAALLLEFGPTKLGVPYRLRRSASHGLAQGVLAVPSVLAALVAAAPKGGWQPWLHGSCSAAFAVLGVVWLHSPAPCLTAASRADGKPADSRLHHSNGVQGDAGETAAAKTIHSPIPVAVKSARASAAAALPSILAVAVLLCSLALATSQHHQQQQMPWFSIPQQWQQLLLAMGTVVGHMSAALPLLVWACLAAASFCLSLQLLPGCFSIGEAALMAQGVTCLIMTAAAALPHAALFVPQVVCSQLQHRALLAVQGLGGCTREAHRAAVSLQGLPAVISLVLAAAVAACLLLRVLYQSARQLRQFLTPSNSSLIPVDQEDLTQPRNGTTTAQQLQQPPQRVALSSTGIQEAALSTNSRSGIACAAAGASAVVVLAAAAGICAVLLWLCCAAAWTLLEFLPAEAGRLGVLLYWVGLLAATLPALKWLARAGNMPQIIVRKVYHLLAMGLFVPVFFWDLQLLALSLAIAFAVLVLLEVLRCTRLPLLGQVVQDFMQAFVDERDTGVIYITHFTLLLGLAVPMWVCLVMPGAQVLLDPHPLLLQGSDDSFPSYFDAQQRGGSALGSNGTVAPSSAAARLAAAAYVFMGRSRVGWTDTAAALFQVTAGLSGLVIIGVGDTAASFVGKLFGKVPVHAGSSKTVEGTLAGISASLCAWVLLLWVVQLLPGVVTAQGVVWWLQLLGATAGSGLMEAATSQLDNILLPLWYLPHLLLAC